MMSWLSDAPPPLPFPSPQHSNDNGGGQAFHDATVSMLCCSRSAGLSRCGDAIGRLLGVSISGIAISGPLFELANRFQDQILAAVSAAFTSWVSIEDACKLATTDSVDLTALECGGVVRVGGAWDGPEEVLHAVAALAHVAIEVLVWFSEHSSHALRGCGAPSARLLVSWIHLATACLSLLRRSAGGDAVFQQLCPIAIGALLAIGCWDCAGDCPAAGTRHALLPSAIRSIADFLIDNTRVPHSRCPELLLSVAPLLTELLRHGLIRRGPCAEETARHLLDLLKEMYTVAPHGIISLLPLLLDRLGVPETHNSATELLLRAVVDFSSPALLSCSVWEAHPLVALSETAVPLNMQSLTLGENRKRSAGTVSRDVKTALPPQSEREQINLVGSEATIFWLVRLLLARSLPNRVSVEGCISDATALPMSFARNPAAFGGALDVVVALSSDAAQAVRVALQGRVSDESYVGRGEVLAALQILLRFAALQAHSGGGSTSSATAPVLVALSGRAQTHLDDAATAACSIPMNETERGQGDVLERACELATCLLAFRWLRVSQEESRVERALRSLEHVVETLYSGHAGALACVLEPLHLLDGTAGCCLDLVLEAAGDAVAGKAGLSSVRQLGTSLNPVNAGLFDGGHRARHSELALATLTACAATDTEAEKYQSVLIVFQLLYSCSESSDDAVNAVARRHMPGFFRVCLDAATNAVLDDVRSALLSVDGNVDPFGGGAKMPVVAGRAIMSLRSRFAVLGRTFATVSGARSTQLLSCILAKHAAVASTALFISYLYERELFYPAMRSPGDASVGTLSSAGASLGGGRFSSRHVAQHPILTCADVRGLLQGGGCDKSTVAALAAASARLFGHGLSDSPVTSAPSDECAPSLQIPAQLPDMLTPPATSFCTPNVHRAACVALERLIIQAQEPGNPPNVTDASPPVSHQTVCDACNSQPGVLLRTSSQVDSTRSLLCRLGMSDMQGSSLTAHSTAGGKLHAAPPQGHAKLRSTQSPQQLHPSGGSSDYVALTPLLLPNLTDAALCALHSTICSTFDPHNAAVAPTEAEVECAGAALRHHAWLRIPLALVGPSTQEHLFSIALRGCISANASVREAAANVVADIVGYLASCGELAVRSTSTSRDAALPSLETPLDTLRRVCRAVLLLDIVVDRAPDPSLQRVVPFSIGDGAEWGSEWDMQGPHAAMLDPEMTTDMVVGPSHSVLGAGMRCLMQFFAIAHRRAVSANRRDVASYALRNLAQVGFLADSATLRGSSLWPQPAFGSAMDVPDASTLGDTRPSGSGLIGSLILWADVRSSHVMAGGRSAGSGHTVRTASFRVAQTLHASARCHLALSVLLIVDAWCCSALQVLPQGSRSRCEMAMSTCQITFRQLAMSCGLSPHALILSLQDELAPRLLPALLHPNPIMLVQAATGATNVQKQEPLLGLFVSTMLDSVVTERELLSQLSFAGLPALMSLVPSTKQQCFLFGCYVAKPSALVAAPAPASAATAVVDLTSQSSPIAATTAPGGAGPSLKRRHSGATPPTTRTLANDVSEPRAATRMVPSGSRIVALHRTMSEAALRRHLHTAVDPLVQHVVVWLLMSVGRAASIAENLQFFLELLPEGSPRNTLLADHFQPILHLLAWNLAEDPLDSGVSRSGLALRIFANLLAGDPRRLELPVTFPLSRMRQAARDISAPLRALLGDAPASPAAAGSWAAPAAGAASSARSSKIAPGAQSGSKLNSHTDLSVPGRIAELAEVSFMLIRISVSKVAGPGLSDTQYAALRELSSLLHGPVDMLLQRYLLMLLSSLSATLSKASEPVHVKARALVVLHRLITRVGGLDKLDKHVPSIIALLKLAQTYSALVLPACAIWELIVRMLSKATLRSYLSSIVVTLSSIAEHWDEWLPLALQALRAASRVSAKPTLTWVHPQLFADCDKKVMADLVSWREAPGVLRVSLRVPETGCQVNAFGAPLPPSGGASGRSQLASGSISSADAAYRRALVSGSVSASVIVQRIFTYLFVDRRDDLSLAIVDLPGTAFLPSLRPFVKVSRGHLSLYNWQAITTNAVPLFRRA